MHSGLEALIYSHDLCKDRSSIYETVFARCGSRRVDSRADSRARSRANSRADNGALV